MSIFLNIILAITLIILLFKFLKFKKLSEIERESFEARLEEETSKREAAENKYQNLDRALPNSALDKKEENYDPKIGNNSDHSEIVKSLNQELTMLRK